MRGRLAIRTNVCVSKPFLQRMQNMCLVFSSPPSKITFQATSRLLFHTSRISTAKAKKGYAKEVSNASDITVELPNLQVFQASIAKPVIWLTSEFAKAKLGQVTPEYFATLMVPSLGALGKLAQVSIKPGGTISFAVFDPSTTSTIVDTIKDCGMNLNPAVDGNNIIAKVPRPSKETREAMIKSLSKLSDKVYDPLPSYKKLQIKSFSPK